MSEDMQAAAGSRPSVDRQTRGREGKDGACYGRFGRPTDRTTDRPIDRMTDALGKEPFVGWVSDAATLVGYI